MSPATTSTPVLTEAGGCGIELWPERAAFLPAQRLLLVADAHLGKAEAFRRLGVPVPGGTTAANLGTISRLLARTAATGLVFLGDLLHARRARSAGLIEAVARWRSQHAAVTMTLVRGNHDALAGDPPAEWGIACVDEPWPLPPPGRLVLCHHPQEVDGAFTLGGHVHPATWVGRGIDGLRLPCFAFGRRQGLLPAFGGFTGGHVVRPAAGDRLFVCAGDEVRALPVA